MSKWLVQVILVLSIIGLLLAGNLTTQHYNLVKKGFDEKSFCSINEWIDCDVVNASSYSEILSIPVAAIGFLFYFLILIFSLLALFTSPHEKSSSLAFSFFLAGGAVLFSLYMAYLCFFVLEVICLQCLGMYLINLLIFILIPLALRIRFLELFSFITNYVTAIFKKTNKLNFSQKFWGHTTFSLIIFALGLLICSQWSEGVMPLEGKLQLDKFVKLQMNQTSHDIDATGRPYWGNPEAKVKIVEFSDFQCPFCQVAANNLKPSIAELKKDVVLYYVNYPLDQSCNPYMQRKMHHHACEAAKAALCAGQKGKFWEYHDIIFANQKKLTSDKFSQFATVLGLDEKEFNECLESEEVSNLVLKDIELAKSLDIGGTPSIYLNGRKFGPWRNMKALRAVIREELKQSR